MPQARSTALAEARQELQEREQLARSFGCAQSQACPGLLVRSASQTRSGLVIQVVLKEARLHSAGRLPEGKGRPQPPGTEFSRGGGRKGGREAGTETQVCVWESEEEFCGWGVATGDTLHVLEET